MTRYLPRWLRGALLRVRPGVDGRLWQDWMLGVGIGGAGAGAPPRVARAAGYCAIGIANIISLLNPEAIVLGGGGPVYLFGSGHSAIPVMDVLPRYGSFVGFNPLYDPTPHVVERHRPARRPRVAAASTIAAVAMAMTIVAETGARLAAAGHRLTTFVSPNVAGVSPDHNLRVFDEYARRWFERPPQPVIP